MVREGKKNMFPKYDLPLKILRTFWNPFSVYLFMLLRNRMKYFASLQLLLLQVPSPWLVYLEWRMCWVLYKTSLIKNWSSLHIPDTNHIQWIGSKEMWQEGKWLCCPINVYGSCSQFWASQGFRTYAVLQWVGSKVVLRHLLVQKVLDTMANIEYCLQNQPKHKWCSNSTPYFFVTLARAMCFLLPPPKWARKILEFHFQYPPHPVS